MAALSCVNLTSVLRRINPASNRPCLGFSPSSYPLQSFRYPSTFVNCFAPGSTPRMFIRNKEVYCNRFNDTLSRRNSTFAICVTTLASARRRTGQNVDLPAILPKRKKKPYLRPPKRGTGKKRRVVQEIVLRTPANGLLVPELIPVAQNVLEARAFLLKGVQELIKTVPVKACRFCSQVHIGSVGHQIATCTGPRSGARKSRHDWINGNIDDIVDPIDVYHLEDRMGSRIKHEDRFDVDRLPAVVELCIQAGIDIPDYPTKRRTKPVHMIGRKIVEIDDAEYTQECEGMDVGIEGLDLQDVENMVAQATTWDGSPRKMRPDEFTSVSQSCSSAMNEEVAITSLETSVIADRTLQAWDAMRSGAVKLMMKYPVKVCGYCPEVHVGPKGHAVKLCGAFKHQWRAGQHGWQDASIDDLIPPKYVWHVHDRDGPPLLNEQKTYYGQTPAVVELCLQAGAALPERYRPMLRLDVAIPDREELEKAA